MLTDTSPKILQDLYDTEPESELNLAFSKGPIGPSCFQHKTENLCPSGIHKTDGLQRWDLRPARLVYQIGLV